MQNNLVMNHEIIREDFFTNPILNQKSGINIKRQTNKFLLDNSKSVTQSKSELIPEKVYQSLSHDNHSKINLKKRGHSIKDLLSLNKKLSTITEKKRKLSPLFHVEVKNKLILKTERSPNRKLHKVIISSPILSNISQNDNKGPVKSNYRITSPKKTKALSCNGPSKIKEDGLSNIKHSSYSNLLTKICHHLCKTKALNKLICKKNKIKGIFDKEEVKKDETIKKFKNKRLRALFILCNSKLITIEEKIKISILNRELYYSIDKRKMIETFEKDFQIKMRLIAEDYVDINDNTKDEIKEQLNYPSKMAVMTLFFLSKKEEYNLKDLTVPENKFFYDIIASLLGKYDSYNSNEACSFKTLFAMYSVNGIKELLVNVILNKVFRDNDNGCIEILKYYPFVKAELICEKIELLLNKYQKKFFWVEMFLKQIKKKLEFYISLSGEKEYNNVARYKKILYLTSLREKVYNFFPKGK